MTIVPAVWVMFDKQLAFRGGFIVVVYEEGATLRFFRLAFKYLIRCSNILTSLASFSLIFSSSLSTFSFFEAKGS